VVESSPWQTLGSTGIGQYIQKNGIALMFWWGGYVLINYGSSYESFLISMFSLLFQRGVYV
jgi:hypothetical protein